MKTHRGRVHQDECRLVVRFYAILLFFIFLLNKSYYQKSLWFGPCTMSKKYLCQQLHTVWWFSKKCFPQLSLAVICRQEIKSLIFCWCIFMLAFERISSAFDFSRSNDFSTSKELPHVNFTKRAMQTKHANNFWKEPQDERLSQKFPQQKTSFKKNRDLF